MSKKNKKVTSSAVHSEVVKSAFTEVLLPKHIELEDRDMIFFKNVIAEFSKFEWSEHQLELAAMLARSLSDLDREQRELRKEGFIIKRQNTTTVENPRCRIVKSLTGDILSLRRSLALHARARGGDNRDVAKTREIMKSMENDVSGLMNDDLIARPYN